MRLCGNSLRLEDFGALLSLFEMCVTSGTTYGNRPRFSAEIPRGSALRRDASDLNKFACDQPLHKKQNMNPQRKATSKYGKVNVRKLRFHGRTVCGNCGGRNVFCQRQTNTTNNVETKLPFSKPRHAVWQELCVPKKVCMHTAYLLKPEVKRHH